MTKARAALTELEGTILGAIRRMPGTTAYAIRRAFMTSLSAEWSGSAGAVYPAIERMQKSGLIQGKAARADGRGTITLTISPRGLALHDKWLADVTRAIGPGSDPFRSRSAAWHLLPAAKRSALLRELTAAIVKDRRRLEAEQPEDQGDAEMQALHLALLETRLRFLERKLSDS